MDYFSDSNCPRDLRAFFIIFNQTKNSSKALGFQKESDLQWRSFYNIYKNLALMIFWSSSTLIAISATVAMVPFMRSILLGASATPTTSSRLHTDWLHSRQFNRFIFSFFCQ